MNKLQIVSLNVRGLRGDKRHTVFRWLADKKFSIALLQETYCTQPFVTKFNKGWNGDVLHCVSDSSHSRGVCILFSKCLDYKLVSHYQCNQGRILIVNVEVAGIGYTIVNIYAPNNPQERIKFFTNVKSLIGSHALFPAKLLLGGDFNSVLASEDRYTKKLDGSSTQLNNLVESMQLFDVWRSKNESSVDFSYIDPTCNMHNSRIDLWLAADTVKHEINSCSIIQAPAPDHKAVVLDTIIQVNTRGKGYWKMNVSVLDDNEYVQLITNVITSTIDEYEHSVSKRALWEYLKRLIKEHTIKFCTMKARARHDQIADLEFKLDQVDQGLNVNKCSKLQGERKVLKLRLDNLYKEKSKGYQIRARAKWVELGETSSAYFCKLEKARQSNNCITSLKDENGHIKTSDMDILSIAHSFYQNLYTSSQTEDKAIDSYLGSLNTERTLSDLEKDSCEGEITLDECTLAVSKMKINKSPGLDGICIEFYKKFWPVVGKLLVDVFNDSYAEGILPDSERTAVMTLIFKKGEEDEIGNFRPISLTNVDYRILAFVLSNRLQNIIPSIVNTDQTAYIKGRYMGQNIRLLLDIINNYNTKDKQGFIMTLDFTKAFDTLEWNFMFKVMKFFNFGESFIKWIKLLYEEPISYIKNNGHLSEQISISRGIRQGCPISGLLFILAVEVLALRIRSSISLKGLPIGNKHIKISQYADDGVLYLNDKDEIGCAINIISNFGNVAGTLLNIDKCEGMCLGSFNTNMVLKKIFGISCKSSIRCLGIYAGSDYAKNYQMNWSVKIEKIKSCLERWESRDLTLFGKVQ